MIKNIVFDVGNVLVDFQWKKVMRNLEMKEEVIEQFGKSVFGSQTWEELDHGTIEQEKGIQQLLQDNYEYKNEFELVWKNRKDFVKVFPYSEDWLRSLKERGYNIYILSNYSKYLFSLHEELGRFPFLKYTDGRVVSAFVKMIKPNHDIYEYLCSLYSLQPEECVFLDDRIDNIQAAIDIGMKGIVFCDFEQADKELNTLLNL